MKLRIGILDYGIGNLCSIKNTLRKLDFRANLSSNQIELRKSDLLILPGVGAYKPAMITIKERGLDKLIYEMNATKKPIIGICLGMQLLGKSSLENDYTKGLNLIPEEVHPLIDNSCHIGWNSAKLIRKDNLINIPDNQDFYFNHSYAFKSNMKYTICETIYKANKFSSIIRKDNIAGLQFHPEKSQFAGLNLLKKLILDMCCNA